jgi:hypothetical protein
MRKIVLFLAILFLPSNLWAADPIIGTWNLNVENSKGTEGVDSPAKEIIMVYRELDSGIIEIKVKRVFMDGTSDSDVLTFPAQGGVALSKDMPEGMSFFEIYLGPGEWCGIYIQDGKQIVSRHKIVSDDGQTLTQTIRGNIDDGDGPIEIIEVFEKQ